MRRLRPWIRAAALAAALAVPATADGAPSMRIGMADGNVLNGSTPGTVDGNLTAWRTAGVDDVRIFAQWNKLAPDPGATAPPAGSELAAAPDRSDLSGLEHRIDAVRAHGMSVTLVVTGPGPVWASGSPKRHDGAWDPDPVRFAAFARAVAARVGPAVDRYIVWNEPNQKVWLQPQRVCAGPRERPTRCRAVAPHLYRELARGAYRAIHAADPTARVAIGATSSRGDRTDVTETSTTRPLAFLRTMACVDRAYRPVRDASCRDFRPLSAEALAYHPHSLKLSPGDHDPDPDNARMGDLPRLERVVDRIATRGRLRVHGRRRLPLWLDEYGYQTDPPDPVDGFQSPRQAATWLQWGWSSAARDPRVELLTQYEWFDEPGTGAQGSDRWQSGLYTWDGRPKPLAAVFPHPIFGWRDRRGGHLWGQVRPGTSTVRVRVQRRSGGSFRTIARTTTDAHGVFTVRVPVRPSVRYRFVYRDPSTRAETASAETVLRAP